MTLLARRVAALVVAALAFVFTVATSPPYEPHPLYATHDERQFNLDPATPAVTGQYVVKLNEQANAVTPSDLYGPLTARFFVQVTGCAAEAIADGGDCPEHDRPRLVISISSADGGSSTDQDAGVRLGDKMVLSVPVFQGCPEGSACEESVRVSVGLASDELRPAVVNLTAGAQAESAVLDQKQPPGAELTVTREP